MNWAQLRSLLRRDYLDAVQDAPDFKDFYWPDTDLDQFLALAEREACRTSRLIREEGTIILEGGVCQYPISASITDIDQVFLSSTPQISLRRVEETGMRCINSGAPQAWYMRGQDFNVYPKPSADQDGLELSFIGFRLPTRPFDESLCGAPEIPEQYHEHLLYYAAYLALIRNDSDSQNSALAQHYLDVFRTHFGKPTDAEARQQRREMPDQIIVRPC